MSEVSKRDREFDSTVLSQDLVTKLLTDAQSKSPSMGASLHQPTAVWEVSLLALVKVRQYVRESGTICPFWIFPMFYKDLW